MNPFVFCIRAASADLGIRDTGKQWFLSGQQATLGLCLHLFLACPLTILLLVQLIYFPLAFSEINKPDVALLMPLASRENLAPSIFYLWSQVG